MKYFLGCLFMLSILPGRGQTTDLPLHSWSYPVLEEWDVKSGEGIFTAIKPYSRHRAVELSDRLSHELTRSDRFDLAYVLLENREYTDTVTAAGKPFLKYFFRAPSDFVSFHNEDLDLHLNPVIRFSVGKDSRSEDPVYVNTRGVEIRGTIDRKVAFYTLLTENQARYPAYVTGVIDSVLAVPYEGFWKRLSDGAGVDFLSAQAYVDFAVTKHISAQFGFGKNFVGDGIRSLVLSDFGNSYPYLKLNTEVWKIQYTNIFAQMIGETVGNTDGLYGTGAFSKKYLSIHRLGMNLSPTFNLGLFESVVFGQPDSLGTNHFKLEYLNPVIFYRALEQQDGSADNVLIGLDFKWNLWKHVRLYGQLVIDELQVKQVLDHTGWWGNKQGLQLGARYFDAFGIPDLNLQGEVNTVRPYTYSHESLFTSYSHYMQPLAHPLGANFSEVIFSATYRPFPKIRLSAVALLSRYGNDADSYSYGRNILRPYTVDNRPPKGDFGHTLAQGDQTDLLLGQATLSYHWKHNAVFDLDLIRRKETTDSAMGDNTSSIFALTFRWNIPARNYLF